jgi:CBS domain-containing protein
MFFLLSMHPVNNRPSSSSLSFLASCAHNPIQVLIQDVLNAKHANRWVDPVIRETSTVREAISYVVEGGLSGMMVVKDDGKVVGLVTSRDVLRILAMGFQDSRLDADSLMNTTVGAHMTPIRQVIYARPDETVGMCRAIMAKLGLKCLPILEGNQVKGLITARDMSDYGLQAIDKGGKEHYLQTVSSRVGLSSSNTSMADPPQYLRAHLALEQKPLYLNVGVAALPHPFKLPGGRTARDRRGKRVQQTTTIVIIKRVYLTTTTHGRRRRPSLSLSLCLHRIDEMSCRHG